MGVQVKGNTSAEGYPASGASQWSRGRASVTPTWRPPRIARPRTIEDIQESLERLENLLPGVEGEQRRKSMLGRIEATKKQLAAMEAANAT
jgi:hypothetical protein